MKKKGLEIATSQVSADVRRLNPHLYPSSVFQAPTNNGPVKAKPVPLNTSPLEEKFLNMWQELGGPELTREHKFHTTRKWRLDFAHLPTKTAIEIQGMVWGRGGHSTGTGIIRDCEKVNNLTLTGWRVFLFPNALITAPNLREVIASLRL